MGSGVELAAVYKGFQNLSKMITGFSKLKTETEISQAQLEMNNIVIELQSKMFAIQTEFSEAQDKIKLLESQISNVQNWEQEKRRYKLVKIDDMSSFAYLLNDSGDENEVLHFICPNCYNNMSKSILQYGKGGLTFITLRCSQCNMEAFAAPDRIKSMLENRD